ncbi:TIGR02710 family CRISPR-associated CARF protein [Picosynechococcus sp. NKBG15041c]|uniref:TIGR02710 family CRISPR-associated CARF protein n=1 Tax=Picosynechococcus sp. NKBG15041c TaxID=1407650 RepID=UPI000401AA46|nr:TIGR02710 family CRISPR-associated CARF protein [Picosynechococcus sp. NKBG15041c]
MSKILFVTVGGSHQPIITSIQSLKPDRTIFICSGGSRGSISQVMGQDKPCEDRRGAEVIDRLPNIPTQLQLRNYDPDTDIVLLDNPDDLSVAYQRISAKVQDIQRTALNSEFLADYTGGTKTMSVALATIALDYQMTLHITTATRINLQKVERGERVRRTAVTGLMVQRLLEQELPRFLGQYNYPAAIAELESLLRDTEIVDTTIIEAYLNFAQGLDLWDRFDHTEAWGYLEPFLNNADLRQLLLFLKRVMGSRQAIAAAVDDKFKAEGSIKGHGYEIVQDLLLNAERRALQERYDDAVARLYRALELLEQVRLWREYEIKTGDLDLNKLPEDLRPQYEVRRSERTGKIQISLAQSYELLQSFPDDPLGQLYSRYKEKLKDKQSFRNYSILAHGMNPVTAAQYQDFYAVVGQFMEEALGTLLAGSKFKRVQFPQSIRLSS